MGRFGFALLLFVFALASVAAEPEKPNLEECSARLREIGEAVEALQVERAALEAAISRLTHGTSDAERQALLAGDVSRLRVGSIANRRLRENGILTVANLVGYTSAQLAFLGVTPRAIAKIEARLAERGLRLSIASEMADPPIEVLNLPKALHERLFHADIRTLGQLAKLSAGDILFMRRFGPAALKAITSALAARGLSLRPE